MLHPTSGCADARAATDPCSRCDLLLGLDRVLVVWSGRDGRGRHGRVLHDVPGATRVQVVWRQRVWRCGDDDYTRKMFVEQLPDLVARRGSTTTRAVSWAIGQLRREHATVHSLARQLGTSWKTVWRAIEPELVRLAADESRFENVTTLGVAEHIWHHVDPL